MILNRGGEAASSEYVDEKVNVVQSSINNLSNITEQMKSIYVRITPGSFSNSAPYTFTVPINWMTSDWIPQSISVKGWSGIDANNIVKLQEFLGYIGMIETFDGSIRITAPETKPDWGGDDWEVDLRIQFTLIKEWVN